MEHGIHHLAHEEGVVARRQLLGDAAFHAGDAILQDRTAGYPLVPGDGVELFPGHRSLEARQKILLLIIDDMQGEMAALHEQIMGIAVGMHRHHEKGRIKGNLADPGGDHAVDRLTGAGGEHVNPVGHVGHGFQQSVLHVGLLSDVQNFLFGEGQSLHAIGGDPIIVLDADGAQAGKDELGLQGEDHVFLERQVEARCHDGQLVDLQADTMAQEADLPLPMTHEMVGQTTLRGHLAGRLEKGFSGDSGPDDRLQVFQDVPAAGMCAGQGRIEFSHHQGAGLVAVVAVDCHPMIDVDRLIPDHPSESGPLGHGRGDADPIDRCFAAGKPGAGLPDQHMGGRHFLVPPAHAHRAHVALPAGEAGQQAIHLDFRHAFADELADFTVVRVNNGGGSSNLFNFVGRFDHPQLSDGR
ncbi:hypothetical protein DESC_610367 [Desulfosarcina cetonica]|nr:hypothetical protein DESC_610367 [Desulfosarcina cetonica]